MSGAATKRQRPMTVGDGVVSGPTDDISLPSSLPECFPLINILPLQILRKLLHQAAELHSDVGKSITIEGSKIISAEEAEIEFDRCSKAALKVLNVNYRLLSSAEQIDKLSEVISEVQECINAVSYATPACATFATKKSALEALLKIGESIVKCNGGALGSEVVKHFQNDNRLESTMLRIVESIPWEERTRIGSDFKFLKKLIHLQQLGDEKDLFIGLFSFGLYLSPCFSAPR